MKATRKNPLSYAIGAVLATMAAVPMTASAIALDVTRGAFATDDGGDALAYPIFSTVNGLTSAFSLTNTSDRDIAVKVRFREQQYSMEVWDTIVFLSVGDKWDFTVSASADPMIPQVSPVAGDTTCTTVPPGDFPSPFRATQFNAAGQPEGRWTVGHVEVIGMMDLTDASLTVPTSVDPILMAALIEGRECAALRAIFTRPDSVAGIDFGNLATIPGDVQNVLIGRYVVGQNGGGLEAGDVPIALANTFNEPLPFAQSAGAGARCSTPITINDGVCMATYAWDQFQESHPHFGDILNGLYGSIDALVGANALEGDWSSNPANFVGTDWLVSFFAKYVYTNFMNCDGAPGNEWCDVLPQWKDNLNTVSPDYAPANPFNAALGATAATEDLPPSPLAAPVACLTIDLWGLDADEHWATGGISPNVPPRICNEVTVIGLAADAATARPSLIQQDTGPFARLLFGFPDLADLGATRGWAHLDLDWPAGANAATPLPAAVSGSLFMTRSEPSNPAANNASLVPLARRFAAPDVQP